MKQLTLLIVLVLFTAVHSHAQSAFKGVGIFGALTESAHYYSNPDKSGYAVYPPNHASKEYFNWGAGAFLELGRDRLRWQTELEYTHTGALEKELLDPITGLRSSSFTANKYTYVQWNNYLKFYYPLGYAHWYFMPGVRLEYLLNNKVTAFTDFSGNFPKFWFSGDLALGYEFPLFKKFSLFAEYHWNPDVIWHKHDNVSMRSKTLELRVGIVMRPRKRAIDDCNAPVYKGPAY